MMTVPELAMNTVAECCCFVNVLASIYCGIAKENSCPRQGTGIG
jgi:hypothetical protein